MSLLRPKPELAIKIIAGLWFISGVNAAFAIGAALVNHRLNFDFTVLGLWLGRALWQHGPRAWPFAVAASWITIIVFILGEVYLVAISPDLLAVSFFGVAVGFVSKWPVIWGMGVLLLLTCWELWTLNRDDVQSFFQATSPAISTPELP